MKLRSRGVIVGTLVILLTFGLGGCTRATPENLLKSMALKTASVQSMEMNIKLEMAASGDILGTTADLTMDMDVDTQTTLDPQAAYVEGKLSMAFMGQKETVDLESYTEAEDGKFISYSRSGSDQWHKAEIEDISTEYDWTVLKDLYQKFELKEGMEKVGNDECYVLSGDLGGEDLEGIIESAIGLMGDSADIFGGIDWDEATIPMEIYIARKTQLPAKITIDAQGLAQSAFEDQELDMDCDTYILEMTYSSFNAVDAIEVPAEVKENAVVSSSVTDYDLSGEASDLTASDEVLEGTEQAMELGANWDSMTVSVNGKVITLPCTYEQLKATGLELDDYDGVTEESVIGAEDTEYVYFMVPGTEAGSISAEVYNTSDLPIKLSNGLITDIEFMASDAGDIEVVFPGNITIGKTAEEAAAVYGVPDYSDNISSGWYIDNDEYEICVNITYDEETKQIDYMRMYYLLW